MLTYMMMYTRNADMARLLYVPTLPTLIMMRIDVLLLVFCSISLHFLLAGGALVDPATCWGYLRPPLRVPPAMVIGATLAMVLVCAISGQPVGDLVDVVGG